MVSIPPGLLLFPAKKDFFIMHEDDIDNDPNLWDPEHPEWFIYDPELLAGWYWDEFVWEITDIISPKEIEEDE